MTLNLNLPPDVERVYLAEAQARGVSIDVLVSEVLLARQPGGADEMSAEDWINAFTAWAGSHSAELPMLSDQAISRESIYGERGL